jgi:hypothetical protein
MNMYVCRPLRVPDGGDGACEGEVDELAHAVQGVVGHALGHGALLVLGQRADEGDQVLGESRAENRSVGRVAGGSKEQGERVIIRR